MLADGERIAHGLNEIAFESLWENIRLLFLGHRPEPEAEWRFEEDIYLCLQRLSSRGCGGERDRTANRCGEFPRLHRGVRERALDILSRSECDADDELEELSLLHARGVGFPCNRADMSSDARSAAFGVIGIVLK